MSRKSNANPLQPASYGEAVQQLEQLIGALEGGQLPLEEVEDQVKVLDEQGGVKPWAAE